jgi:hypothetical protein
LPSLGSSQLFGFFTAAIATFTFFLADFIFSCGLPVDLIHICV